MGNDFRRAVEKRFELRKSPNMGFFPNRGFRRFHIRLDKPKPKGIQPNKGIVNVLPLLLDIAHNLVHIALLPFLLDRLINIDTSNNNIRNGISSRECPVQTDGFICRLVTKINVPL
jgi:hypothetical protein